MVGLAHHNISPLLTKQLVLELKVRMRYAKRIELQMPASSPITPEYATDLDEVGNATRDQDEAAVVHVAGAVVAAQTKEGRHGMASKRPRETHRGCGRLLATPGGRQPDQPAPPPDRVLHSMS